ncbi:MAG: ExeM/NucH family extracellular endonuclease, partial [Cellulomonadaceae bacterium]
VSSALTCRSAACATDDAVVDLVGYGTGAAFAGAGPAPAPSNTTSIARTNGVNTADNAADFTAGAPTPTSSTGGQEPEEPEEPGDPLILTVAEIQGTGDASPHVDKLVVTSGVVTAAYPTGGFNGFVIQTAGTGTEVGTASHAVFVYTGAGTPPTVTVGDHLEVTGTVAEFNGLTQLTAPQIAVLDEPAVAVKPLATAWPTTDAEREVLESMLIEPVGDFTVSNTYSTNQYGEVGLAAGGTPLLQPTDVARPSTAEADAVVADNAARAVTVDDGATTNFLSAANRTQVPPYVSLTAPVRVGAPVTFTEPVIVDYRNNTWKLNPTAQALPGEEPATFGNTRTAAPAAHALGSGELSVASFNVLNYFTTLGEDWGNCTAYADRAGTPITVNSCPNNGPRGAWDTASLERQQAKIVAAITALDADVVGLMEIENSAALGEEPDEAIATLVAALNTAAGAETWDYVPSSTDLPEVSEQDVITNAIIYQPAAVTPDGDAVALGDQSGAGEAFVNAREPIGQVFAPVAGGEDFLVVVNHFKSKGSAGPLPGDADAGDGQGASNASRVAQATALADWLPAVQQDAGVESVALLGDFNSYTHEDPLQVLYDAGFTNATEALNPGEYSYSYQGLVGSLDHVLVNEAFLERATGSDVWEINAPESIALEYSRYNSHGVLFYDTSPFRSSDHDPVVLAFDAPVTPEPTDPPTTVEPTDPEPSGPPATTSPGGAGTGPDASAPPAPGAMPNTGAEPLWLIVGAVVLLGAGVVAVVVTRRRSS